MKFIILKGGLGNQLFQLAKFIYLLEECNIKNLQIDYVSGFFLDLKYKRRLEIKQVKKISSISLKRIIKNILILIMNKFCPLVNYLLGFKIINDHSTFNEYITENKYILFNGYFQKYTYVENTIDKIFKLIKPNLKIKSSKKFEQLYLKINSCENPVALGIRFYEESNNPSAHQQPNTKIKTPSDFNKIINKFENELNNPTFFVFIQNENEFTRNLKFNSEFHLITHDAGYKGSWPRLMAQILCKHHIFNNSTFYYWGALFSDYLNKNNKKKKNVFVSDNFMFPEIYNPKWKKF